MLAECAHGNIADCTMGSGVADQRTYKLLAYAGLYVNMVQLTCALQVSLLLLLLFFF